MYKQSPEGQHYTTPSFIKSMDEQVVKMTWGNNLPMIYKNEKGEMVKHYRDGKIIVIDKTND